MKRLILFLLTGALFLALGSAAAEQTIRGWNKQAGYQYIYFGSYPTLKDGTEAAVLWKVLDVDEEGRALLITDQVIDAYPVQRISSRQQLLDHDYRPMANYEESDLYPWMNTEMADTLFTAQQQSVLDESRGKLFLLDRNEFLNTTYGFSASVYGVVKSRIAVPTQYALKRGVYREEGGATYWTSTLRAVDGYQLQIVGYNGHMSWAGYGRENVGIRPCILLCTDKVVITAGEGKRKDPCHIIVK